jgi:hypothetical protein
VSKPRTVAGHPVITCPWCGENPCRPEGRAVAELEFVDAEAWRELYWFLMNVQLPFVHQVLARARARGDVA